MGEQGWGRGAASLDGMRIIVADCCAEYTGRLSASLPLAKRVLLIKADNSLLIFSEIGSYKPLNWMLSPCTIKDITPQDADDDPATPTPEKIIRVQSTKTNDVLEVTLQHIYSDETHDLGTDPGLRKDGVEDHLQRYLAEQIERIGRAPSSCAVNTRPQSARWTSWPSTPTARMWPSRSNATAASTAWNSSRAIASCSTATPCSPLFAASSPHRRSPRRRRCSPHRGFDCLLLDYDDMKGTDDGALRLF